MGHKVMLSPPIYVKPFVKREKTDAADAMTICEAMGRPTSRMTSDQRYDSRPSAAHFLKWNDSAILCERSF